MSSSSFRFFFSLFFNAFSFFTTLYVLISPKVPFLAFFSTLQAPLMISFNTMSLTSTGMLVFLKFIFPAGTSLLELQLHISYHQCDTSFNNVTKGNANSIYLKLNLFHFLPHKTPGPSSCVSYLS